MDTPSNIDSHDAMPTDARRAMARSIAADVGRRWDSGELIGDEKILSEHPLIQEELVEELHAARLIRGALLAARRAGEINEPLKILTQAELDAPIDWFESEIAEDARDTAIKIEGYGLLQLLRQGGQAAVYKGVQEATGRNVAIKIMNCGSALNSRNRIRFDREANILARLNHRNIVSIIDKGRSKCGSFVLVMEYVDGPELDEYCRTHFPHNEQGTRELLRLFVKIATAVNVAQLNGIVHRDLKPSNIRIDEYGEPRLLDFGLASLAADFDRSATISGQIVGSIPWASPEQAAGRADIGPACDVYALGVMLFQMIAGRFPYATDGPLHEALANIATAAAPKPTSVPGARRFKGSNLLDAVITKALEKRPEARYADAGALALDLDAALNGTRPSIAVPSQYRKTPLAVGVGLLILCLGAFGWHGSRPSPPVVMKLPEFVNTIGMHFVRVPSGRLAARVSNSDKYTALKMIDVGAFYLGTTEVTQSQFEKVMGFNPSDHRWIGGKLPVDMVNFQDAATFCTKLSAKEHRSYRLPTEDEWQYAASGGQDRYLTAAEANNSAWSAGNSNRQLHAVGQLWPNAYGLFDMNGDVAELTADTLPILRLTSCGGSFLTPLETIQRTPRSTLYPESRHPDLGFRVVMASDHP